MFRERFIHGMLYKARADVMAVVHSHSPAVIPYGITQVKMQPTFHMAAFLYEEPPVFEIRDVAGWTNMLITSNELGKALAETLGEKSVALMRGHGNIVVGPTLPIAVFRAIYTEVNARLQTTAIMLGGPINYLSPEEGEIITYKSKGDVGRAWNCGRPRRWGNRFTARQEGGAGSPLAPETFTTCAHFSTSARRYLSNSAGVISIGTAPCLAQAPLTSSRCTIFCISLLSLSMIGFGVPAGAMTPSQIVAS